MAAIVYLILANFDGLLGVPPSSPLRWTFPAGYGLLAIGGVAWALYLRATRPDVYDAIGLGTPALAARRPANPAMSTSV